MKNPNNDLMTLLKLTKDIRETQKEYFRTRSKGVLIESKAKEQALDQYLGKLSADYSDELEHHTIIK